MQGCELLTSDNWAYSPETQAISKSSHERSLAFQKESILESELFVVQLCVEKCFQAIGAGYWSERSTLYNPSAAADVKDIEFHKDQNIYKLTYGTANLGGKHLFIDHEKNYLQLEKEN